MKCKNLVINILLYILSYHIVFEALVSYYNFDEVDRKILTPLGRIFRKYLFHQKDIFTTFSLSDFYIFIFNLFISTILI